MTIHFSAISLNKLKLRVCVGVSDEERAHPQDVEVSVRFFFETPPLGCETDNIADTICYHDIADGIRSFCEDKEFNLLERMGKQLHMLIREIIHSDVKLWVKVTKCNPPVDGLESSDFVYSDLPSVAACGIA